MQIHTFSVWIKSLSRICMNEICDKLSLQGFIPKSKYLIKERGFSFFSQNYVYNIVQIEFFIQMTQK